MSDIHDALHRHGHRTEDGRWWFSDERFTHNETTALTISAACLSLGVPVTDVLRANSWFRLIERVMQLEERLERLEGASA